MPKRMPRPKDKYKRSVIIKIEHLFELRDISVEGQRSIARCSQTAWNDRRRDPGWFRLDEIIRLAKKLGVQPWELLKPEDENIKIS